jgi:hypothetical protein
MIHDNDPENHDNDPDDVKVNPLKLVRQGEESGCRFRNDLQNRRYHV